jgi:hypothetical protein
MSSVKARIGNLGRRPLCGANCGVSARQDDIDLGFDQLGRMFLELLDAQPVTAPIDREVLHRDLHAHEEHRAANPGFQRS